MFYTYYYYASIIFAEIDRGKPAEYFVHALCIGCKRKP